MKNAYRLNPFVPNSKLLSVSPIRGPKGHALPGGGTLVRLLRRPLPQADSLPTFGARGTHPIGANPGGSYHRTPG